MSDKRDKKLTLKYALKNKFTAIDCVKFFDPSVPDDFCDFILWELTCFPFNKKMMIKQLNEIFNKKK